MFYINLSSIVLSIKIPGFTIYGCCHPYSNSYFLEFKDFLRKENNFRNSKYLQIKNFDKEKRILAI